MVETMKHFTVKYERDVESGWWVAQVKEAPSAITQGRTIPEARRRIREALSLVLNDSHIAETANLVDEVRLPADAMRALSRVRAARHRMEIESKRAQTSTKVAVRKLSGRLGLSVRDTGELVGISYQRVHQLMHH
jgi:predicted RNase H-like HicB family nuclease